MPTRSIRKRVSRRKWDADSPKCRTLIFPGELRGFAIHYSGAMQDRRKDHDECLEVVKGFQRFHMSPGGLGAPNGACDIAYNHLFCLHGHTIVGRGFWHRSGANGDTDANRYYLAACVIGGDRIGKRDINREIRESLYVYRKRLLTIHPRAKEVRWHSLFKNTACPGDELRSFAKAAWPNATP